MAGCPLVLRHVTKTANLHRDNWRLDSGAPMNFHTYTKRLYLTAVVTVCALGWLVPLRIARADAPATETLNAHIDGKNWVATHAFATLTHIGIKPVVSLTGTFESKPSSRFTFNIFMPTDEKFVGAFELGKGNATSASHGGYFANAGLGGNPLEDNYRFIDGNVTIESFDAATRAIAGTFAGTAKNSSGRTVKIESGHFAGINLPPAAP